MKIINYEIIVTDTREQMVESVKNHIEAGWQPLGGVSFMEVEIDEWRSEQWFAQAVVAYEVS